VGVGCWMKVVAAEIPSKRIVGLLRISIRVDGAGRADSRNARFRVIFVSILK